MTFPLFVRGLCGWEIHGIMIRQAEGLAGSLTCAGATIMV